MFNFDFDFEAGLKLKLKLKLNRRVGWMKEAPGDPKGGVSGGFADETGDDVLSHPGFRAVPSARRGLTTVFGMGTGVTLAP